jgi:hypothetical protein
MEEMELAADQEVMEKDLGLVLGMREVVVHI